MDLYLQRILDIILIFTTHGHHTELRVKGVFIAYTSVYGNTKKAAELLKEKLEEKGCPKVAIADLAREDMAESVEDAFSYRSLYLQQLPTMPIYSHS